LSRRRKEQGRRVDASLTHQRRVLRFVDDESKVPPPPLACFPEQRDVLLLPRLSGIVHADTSKPTRVRRIMDVGDELLSEGEGADMVESLDDESFEGGRDETDDSRGDFGRGDGKGFKAVVEREEAVEDRLGGRVEVGEVLVCRADREEGENSVPVRKERKWREGKRTCRGSGCASSTERRVEGRRWFYGSGGSTAKGGKENRK
jgi:hypothetical protein